MSPHLALLDEITHCEHVPEAMEQPQHPCSRVVATQAVALGGFQVPEPWAGSLAVAPLLFISSNPSISDQEPYPLWSDDAARRRAFFEGRFGAGPEQVKDGVYGPLRQPRADGLTHTRRPVSFWNACKRNAALLHQVPVPDVVPGRDYAMTEVVHCKSRAEAGVAEARRFCTFQWLPRVLEVSPARVLVLVGAQAGLGFRDVYGLDLEYWSVATVEAGGRSRQVLMSRHPNYRGPRKWADRISSDLLSSLRTALAQR